MAKRVRGERARAVRSGPGLLSPLEKAACAEDPARVINIGSVYAETTRVMQAYSYTASKAAIHQLTRVMARELAPRHILVNAIAPGCSLEYDGGVAEDASMREATLAEIPRGRAEPSRTSEEPPYSFSSRAGAYMTGAVIPLDGGLLVAH